MTELSAPGVANRRSFGHRLGFIAGAFAILVTVGGAVYYQRQREHSRDSIWRELETIADLKVRQLADWRSERLNDGRFLAHTPAVAKGVASLRSAPESAAAQAAVADWLRPIKGGDRYASIVLVDRQLAPRLATPFEVNRLLAAAGQPPRYASPRSPAGGEGAAA